MLTGVVEVALSGGLLTLTGDQPLVSGDSSQPSDNWVEVSQGAATGQFHVAGKGSTLLSVDGSLMADVTINGVISIDVQLGLMNDTFELSGGPAVGPEAGAKSDPALIRGDLTIDNDQCGVNTNLLNNVLVKGDVDVEKVAGTLGRSELKMHDVTVEGAVTVDNANGGGGSTLTVLHRVHIEEQLTITNNYDFDTVDIQDSEIDKATAAGTVITNGPGGSRTTFTSTGAAGNTLYGSLDIYNGANPIDVPGLPQLDDLVTFNNTDVRGAVLIDNDGGDSRVAVLAGSTLGSNINTAGPVTVLNGAGVDMFDMQSSEAPFGVSIDYAVSNNTTDMYGSTTTIYDSVLGNCLSACNESLFVLGDNAADKVEVTESNLTGEVKLKLYDGNNMVLIEQNEPIQRLTVRTGNGIDMVAIRGSSVDDRQEVLIPIIELGGKNDSLVMEHVLIQGDALLDGDSVLNLAAQDLLDAAVDVIFSGGTVDRVNWEIIL